MKFRDYKVFLLNHPVIKKMDSYDYKLFTDGIKNNKPFNNMSYFINKYNMSDEEFLLIHKYTIYINNSFTDDDDI